MTEHGNIKATNILDKIPVTIEPETINKHLRMRNTSDRIQGMIHELINLVVPEVQPKALYKASRLGRIDEEVLELEGVKFFHKMKTHAHHEGILIFPYVVTCGLEIEAIKIPSNDSMKVMKEYCLNVIKTVVVREANSFLRDHLKETFHLEDISHIGPGEIMGDISQQHKLFSILGDVEKAIGVTLSSHYLMYPEKSNSGIYFTNKHFVV